MQTLSPVGGPVMGETNIIISGTGMQITGEIRVLMCPGSCPQFQHLDINDPDDEEVFKWTVEASFVDEQSVKAVTPASIYGNGDMAMCQSLRQYWLLA